MDKSPRYQKSLEFLERAEKVIPLGSQTFSKSRTQFPLGISPHFLTRGKGSKVWDIDGNEYLDMINALCAVTLGYADPDVDAAVTEQLKNGVSFTLSHPLETEVAEKLVEHIPCAEMVRFGKNGSDATSGCIRLARAHTGRDHVAVCGYHGWQDWYIGSTARNRGVPQATRDLTHPFVYNEIETLHHLFKQHPGQIAAVILEPISMAIPKPGFLESVKEVAHKNGAVLIFDEVITGFRCSLGGAQAEVGVTPDLAAIGKGLANGYPLSAIVGRADIMKLMEEVYFSFTFGGECISLAAAKAVIQKLEREPVLDTMKQIGTQVVAGVQKLIIENDLEGVIGISGAMESWTALTFADTPQFSQHQLKTLFMQEVLERGVLSLGTHVISYAHSEQDILNLLDIYQQTFREISEGVREKTIEQKLKVAPLEPLFKVRQ